MPQIDEYPSASALSGAVLLGSQSGATKKFPATLMDDRYVRAIGGGVEGYDAHGGTGVGTTETVDLANGNVHRLLLDENCTISFTGWTNSKACSVTVMAVQDGTGGSTPTFSGVTWLGGSAPTPDTAANAIDFYTFLSVDGGTTIYGFLAGAASTSGGGESPGLDNLTDFNAAYGTGITTYDQEFSAVGSSLPSGWSWFNQGSATYAEQLGAGIVTHVSGSGYNWRGLVRGLPSESTWTAYSRITGTQSATAESYVGIILTDGTKVIQCGLYSANGSPYTGGVGTTYMDRWTNATTYSAAITSLSVHDWPRYYRVKRNSATSYDFAVSTDGVTWIPVQTGYDVSAFMTPTHIGMGGNIKTSRADQTAIHWFRVR